MPRTKEHGAKATRPRRSGGPSATSPQVMDILESHFESVNRAYLVSFRLQLTTASHQQINSVIVSSEEVEGLFFELNSLSLMGQKYIYCHIRDETQAALAETCNFPF